MQKEITLSLFYGILRLIDHKIQVLTTYFKNGLCILIFKFTEKYCEVGDCVETQKNVILKSNLPLNNCSCRKYLPEVLKILS